MPRSSWREETRHEETNKLLGAQLALVLGVLPALGTTALAACMHQLCTGGEVALEIGGSKWYSIYGTRRDWPAGEPRAGGRQLLQGARHVAARRRHWRLTVAGPRLQRYTGISPVGGGGGNKKPSANWTDLRDRKGAVH